MTIVLRKSPWGYLGLKTLSTTTKPYVPTNIFFLCWPCGRDDRLSFGELHEKFSEYLVPDLMCMYQKPLKPELKTLDVLKHTELTKHK